MSFCLFVHRSYVTSGAADVQHMISLFTIRIVGAIYILVDGAAGSMAFCFGSRDYIHSLLFPKHWPVALALTAFMLAAGPRKADRGIAAGIWLCWAAGALAITEVAKPGLQDAYSQLILRPIREELYFLYLYIIAAVAWHSLCLFNTESRSRLLAALLALMAFVLFIAAIIALMVSTRSPFLSLLVLCIASWGCFVLQLLLMELPGWPTQDAASNRDGQDGPGPSR